MNKEFLWNLPYRSDRRGLLRFVAAVAATLVVLAVPFWVAGKAFAFVDIGGDTFVQFLPLQMAGSRQWHEMHALTWSFSIGLGGYLGAALDPFWMLGSLLPESWQLGLRLPAYLAKLMLGGAFFFAYLRVIGFATSIATFGAFAYALSSYALVNAQWDPHGTEFVQFAAYLYFFEMCMLARRLRYAVLAGIVVGVGPTFGIYTFGLLTLVYGALKLVAAESGTRGQFLQNYVRFGIGCVLGLLLLAPLQLPGLYYLFDSPRVTGASSSLAALLGSMTSVNDRVVLASEFAGMLGKNLLGAVDAYKGYGNWFEGPAFYVGLLPLFGIAQLLGPRATPFERRLCIGVLVFVALYCLFPAIRYTVYGFGHNAFRFSTLWVSAALLVVGLAGLRRLFADDAWVPGLVLAALGIGAIAFGTAWILPDKVAYAQVAALLGFAAVYAVLLGCMPGRSERRRFAVGLLAVFACELLVMAQPAMVGRAAADTAGTSPLGSYADGTREAVAWIEARESADAFYRIEKSYNSVFLCDALAQGYAGVKSYYFHGSSLSRFIDALSLARPVPGAVSYIGPALERRGVLDLVGVKYLLARDRAYDAVAGFRYLHSVGPVSIYQNLQALGIGTLHSQFVAESEVSALPPEQREAALATRVTVERPESLHQDFEALRRLPAQPGLADTVDVRRLRDDRLEVSAENAEARILLLSIPFDRGWQAWSGGQAVSTFRADFGLTALLLPPGKHALELRYSPPGRSLGWKLALGAALLLGLLAYARMAPRRT
ncbi:MAG TPA: YfhO family protein, partial [Tahibacter sp.]|nr:YfhO family protein [Tahibacter sp.]